MEVNNKIYYDGIEYGTTDTLPDLGSLINKGDGDDRVYWGLAAHASKLPTVSAYPKYRGRIKTGSLFIATDSKLVKVYTESTDAWTERS